MSKIPAFKVGDRVVAKAKPPRERLDRPLYPGAVHRISYIDQHGGPSYLLAEHDGIATPPFYDEDEFECYSLGKGVTTYIALLDTYVVAEAITYEAAKSALQGCVAYLVAGTSARILKINGEILFKLKPTVELEVQEVGGSNA